MDTTRLSDREIEMLAYVISNKFWIKLKIMLKLHLVCTMLNIPLEIFYFCNEPHIKSMFSYTIRVGALVEHFLEIVWLLFVMMKLK